MAFSFHSNLNSFFSRFPIRTLASSLSPKAKNGKSLALDVRTAVFLSYLLHYIEVHLDANSSRLERKQNTNRIRFSTKTIFLFIN